MVPNPQTDGAVPFVEVAQGSRGIRLFDLALLINDMEIL